MIKLALERYLFLLQLRQLCRQFFGSLLRLYQLLFDLLASFAERLLPVLDRHCPGCEHGIGYGSRQGCSQRVNLGLLVFPEFQLIVDAGSASLTDLGVNQINRNFVCLPPICYQSGGGFAGPEARVTDAAHRPFAVDQAAPRCREDNGYINITLRT